MRNTQFLKLRVNLYLSVLSPMSVISTTVRSSASASGRPFRIRYLWIFRSEQRGKFAERRRISPGESLGQRFRVGTWNHEDVFCHI